MSTTTHDRTLAALKARLAQVQIETEDRVVSGFTGHYLPNGLYVYIGTPKGEGPVKITTNVHMEGCQPHWMPRGSVRSAFMSNELQKFEEMCKLLKDPATTAPARKAPVRRQAVASQAASPATDAPPITQQLTQEEADQLLYAGLEQQ